jgi:hypothetical protein
MWVRVSLFTIEKLSLCLIEGALAYGWIPYATNEEHGTGRTIHRHWFYHPHAGMEVEGSVKII